jgi:hypothetical protein
MREGKEEPSVKDAEKRHEKRRKREVGKTNRTRIP